MKRVDEAIERKFAVAAGILMTRVFSTPLESNPRRLAFASGPAMRGGTRAVSRPQSPFDVLGLGFRPGREWSGPSEIFLEETRAGQLRTWTDCKLWAATSNGPLYLLTGDPEVCFSYDGHSLVALSGQPDDLEDGISLARTLLRAAARRVPDDIEQHRMM